MSSLWNHNLDVPLEEIDLHLNQNELPADVNNFLVEADRRIDELFDSERNRKVPRFIPSNAELHTIIFLQSFQRIYV